jgi:hypothetical protein
MKKCKTKFLVKWSHQGFELDSSDAFEIMNSFGQLAGVFDGGLSRRKT